MLVNSSRLASLKSTGADWAKHARLKRRKKVRFDLAAPAKPLPRTVILCFFKVPRNPLGGRRV
jgi:hypothetical protein